MRWRDPRGRGRLRRDDRRPAGPAEGPPGRPRWPGAKGEKAAWGWQASTDEDDESAHPRGDRIGWVDDESLYLIPAVTHRLVAKTVGERGDAFIVSTAPCARPSTAAGSCCPGNKDGGRRHNVRAEGRPRNVLRLGRRAVERLWAGTS